MKKSSDIENELEISNTVQEAKNQLRTSKEKWNTCKVDTKKHRKEELLDLSKQIIKDRNTEKKKKRKNQ